MIGKSFFFSSISKLKLFPWIRNGCYYSINTQRLKKKGTRVICKMNKFSTAFLSSVCINVKKECLTIANLVPNDATLQYLLKLLTSKYPLNILNENDLKKHADSLISSMVNFMTSTGSSPKTLQIQMYFMQHHFSKEKILADRHETVVRNTETLLQHILQKRIKKNKEDCDQLYHFISCYIILVSGFGDPTDDEVIKETIVALKSILSSKEMLRFASKSSSIKEKQLADVCSIVTGIKIYNKDSSQKSKVENESKKAFQKCSLFLELKLRQIEERSWKIVQICMNSVSNQEDTIELKSYLILLQQMKIYFRTTCQECHELTEQFQMCCVIFEQRLARVRKTVKCRTAIPVVEIYPQFKDIALSWETIQQLTTLLNHLSEIVHDIWQLYDEADKPNIENVSSPPVHDTSRISKDVFVKNTVCEVVTSKNADNFYDITVEYSECCIVTFVEYNGLLVFGIREYGLIKYNNKYYCFATVANANKFCLQPEKYIRETKNLAFTWPETISLLKMEKEFEYDELEKEDKSIRNLPSVADVEVQTEIHPVLSYKDYQYSSSVWQLQQRIVYLAGLKKYRTHSVQTLESNFRKNSCTQTDKCRYYK